MLTRVDGARVKALEKEGHSRKAIAGLLHMSGRDVRAILEETFRYKMRKPLKVNGKNALPKLNDGVKPPDMLSEAQWCYECAATVYEPCLACQIRDLVKKKKRK